MKSIDILRNETGLAVHNYIYNLNAIRLPQIMKNIYSYYINGRDKEDTTFLTCNGVSSLLVLGQSRGMSLFQKHI